MKALRRLHLVVRATAALALLASCAQEPADPWPAPSLDISKIVAETTDFQREMLADHKVTFAEYEKATLATVECLKAAGYVVDGPYPRPGDERFLHFTYSFKGGPEQDPDAAFARAAEAGESCERSYRADVARVWQFQNLLTPEERETQRRELIICLRAAGIDIAEDADSAEVLRVAAELRNEPAVEQCRLKYPDFFVVGA